MVTAQLSTPNSPELNTRSEKRMPKLQYPKKVVLGDITVRDGFQLFVLLFAFIIIPSFQHSNLFAL